MRKLLAPPLVLILVAACGGQGEAPSSADSGLGESCHVENDGEALVLTCPGSDPVRIEAATTCTIEGQTLKCPGSADVTIPTAAGCVVKSSSPGAMVLDCGNGVEVPVRFQEVGTILGKAILYGSTDASVIQVKVPGTELVTHPATDGTLEWKDIPAGIFDLEFSADGYYPQTVHHVALVGGYFDLGNVELFRGRLVLPDGQVANACGGQGTSPCEAPSGHTAIVEQNGRFGAITYATGDVQWMIGFTSGQNGVFSPQEGYFYDGTSVWDLSTGGATPFVGPVEFSGDDKRVARKPYFNYLSGLRYIDLATHEQHVLPVAALDVLGTADGFLWTNLQQVTWLKPTGEAVKIGDYPEAALIISPDRRLATVRNVAGIFGLDLKDPTLPANNVPITSKPYEPYRASFAPNGKGIAVLESKGAGIGVPNLRLWNRFKGSTPISLGDSGQDPGVFSPDSGWFAYYRWSNTGTNVLMLRSLIDDKTTELSNKRSITKQQFDPRSKRLVWLQGTIAGTVELGIWEPGSAMKTPELLGRNVDNSGVKPFVYSPDGKYLAYTEKLGSTFKLMLEDITDVTKLGPPVELVSISSRFDYTFTPDSKALVFGSLGATGPLSVVDVVSKNVTDLGEASSFIMTSDGAGVVFVRAADVGSEVVLWHRATGVITAVDIAPQFQLLEANVDGKAFYVRLGAGDSRPNGMYELPLPSAN